MIVRRRGERFNKHLAHETLTVSQLVFLNSDGEWELANAASGTATLSIGVVTLGAAAGAYPEVCTWAYITGYTTGLTPGGELFGSAATAGAATQTPPAAENDVDQVVGWALTALNVWLEPMVVAKTTAGANIVHGA